MLRIRQKKFDKNRNQSLDQLLKSNNRHALIKHVDCISDQLDTTFEADHLPFDDILKATCLIGNKRVLEKLLNKCTSTRSRQNTITAETIYYAIKGYKACKTNDTMDTDYCDQCMQILELLIEYTSKCNGEDPTCLGNYLTDSKDNTTLIQAIRNQSLEQVKFLVEKCGASVNFAEKSMMHYPLHFAVARQNSQIVKYLIDHKADLNSKTRSHETPVLRACRSRNLAGLTMLIDSGADVNARDIYGNAPIHFICPCTFSDDGLDACDKPLDYLKVLLSADTIDLTVKNDRQLSGFSRACQNASIQTVDYFLNHLIKKTDMQQPHSICKVVNGSNPVKVIFGADYLNEEVTDGLCNALIYLNFETIQLLLGQLRSKKYLTMRLKELFEEHLISSIIHKYTPSAINSMFKLFIQYDCFPHNDNCFFFIRMLAQIVLADRRHTITSEQLAVLGECLTEQVDLMIRFGIIRHLDQIEYLKTIVGSCLGHIQLDRFELDLANVRSLKDQCRNLLRHKIISLSHCNLNSLQLPQTLKKFIVYG